MFYQSDLARRQLLLHLLAPQRHAAPYTPLELHAAPHDAAATPRSEGGEGRASEGRVYQGSEPHTWLPTSEAEAGEAEEGAHISREMSRESAPPEVVMASGLVAEELADALRSSVLPPDLFSAMAEYEQLMGLGAQSTIQAEISCDIDGEIGEVGEVGQMGGVGGAAAKLAAAAKSKASAAAAAEASASLRGKDAADALFAGKGGGGGGDGRGVKGAGAEAKGAESAAAEGAAAAARLAVPPRALLADVLMASLARKPNPSLLVVAASAPTAAFASAPSSSAAAAASASTSTPKTASTSTPNTAGAEDGAAAAAAAAEAEGGAAGGAELMRLVTEMLEVEAGH